jgi:hypothetical protein
MFTGAVLTGIVSFIGGDALMLLAGRLAPPSAVKAGAALIRVLKVIEAHGEHLPEGARRQIAEEALKSGQASKASVLQGWVRNGWGN